MPRKVIVKQNILDSWLLCASITRWSADLRDAVRISGGAVCVLLPIHRHCCENGRLGPSQGKLSTKASCLIQCDSQKLWTRFCTRLLQILRLKVGSRFFLEMVTVSITMKSFQFIFYDNILDENNVRKKGFV